jgi:hypothetical protein
MKTINKVQEIISGLNKWLKSINYNYFEYSYLPRKLISNNHLINIFIRLFFRLSPVNFRKKEAYYPATPQSLVALLKAYNVSGDTDIISLLLPRILSLKSPKAKNFALCQGIHIAVRMYENDSLDPTPLNTVWFGQFILDSKLDIIDTYTRKELLASIAEYLVTELGYIDHGEHGIYFFYGPTLKQEIYNASALISAYLLRIGYEYDIDIYKTLGERGIKYIANKQNIDGSWFYSAEINKISIDNFHQSYILQALFQARQYISFSIDTFIEKGVGYYKNNLFKYKDKYIIPIRYDKRYIPKNTWILQKLDGRDIADALILFSKYHFDKAMLDGLISYIYDYIFMKDKGYLVSEILIYGKNKIPYFEFQAWYLYALETVLKYFTE